MGALLPIEQLKSKDIKNGVAAVKFLKAMYNISDEDLMSLNADIARLEAKVVVLEEENARLKARLDEMTEVMNNNNKHFNDRLDQVIAEFKIRIADEVKDEKDRYERIEVDFDANR